LPGRGRDMGERMGEKSEPELTYRAPGGGSADISTVTYEASWKRKCE